MPSARLSELKPIFSPTIPASVKPNVRMPFGAVVFKIEPWTWGIQSQFCPMRRCPSSLLAGWMAKEVQPSLNSLSASSDWIF